MHHPDLTRQGRSHHGSFVGHRRGDGACARRRRRRGRAGAPAARTGSRSSRSGSSSDGGRAVAIPTDVSKEDEAKAFVEQANEQLGRLDILVNNAGLMLLGPVYGADTSEWRTWSRSTCSASSTARTPRCRSWASQGSGHIVNISSVAGRNATFGAAVYNLTKFGVNGFSEALRQELAPANVRVTVVEPGFVETELQGHNTHPMVVDAHREGAGGDRRPAPGRRHRRRDPLRGRRAAARVGQRGAGPPDGAAALKQALSKKEEQSLQTRERLLEAAAGAVRQERLPRHVGAADRRGRRHQPRLDLLALRVQGGAAVGGRRAGLRALAGRGAGSGRGRGAAASRRCTARSRPTGGSSPSRRTRCASS